MYSDILSRLVNSTNFSNDEAILRAYCDYLICLVSSHLFCCPSINMLNFFRRFLQLSTEFYLVRYRKINLHSNKYLIVWTLSFFSSWLKRLVRSKCEIRWGIFYLHLIFEKMKKVNYSANAQNPKENASLLSSIFFW